MANADDLTADEHDYLTRLCHVCPQVALAQALAREFHTLIRERDVPGLYAWLHGVRQSGIAEFMSVAAGIWRDRQAVEAALTHVESQGQTEGQVNRLNSGSSAAAMVAPASTCCADASSWPAKSAIFEHQK